MAAIEFSGKEIYSRVLQAVPGVSENYVINLINEALVDMGMKNLIGKGPQCLVPAASHAESSRSAPKAARGKQGMTKHTSPRSQKMRRSR